MKINVGDMGQMGIFPGKMVVALGMFDGVHTAHRALLSLARQRADALGAGSAVVTFYQHPSVVLTPEKPTPQIMTARARMAALRGAGVDYLWMMPFTEALARLSAESFLEKLLAACDVRAIVAGYNYRFGAGARGDTAMLRRFGGQRGIEVCVVGEVDHEGTPVSSTRIRQCLMDGDVAGAETMLQRPYCLRGRVVGGRQIGRSIQTPTANILYSSRVILPMAGVYITRARWNGAWHPAVTNIGNNPTVGASGVMVETHILDMREDLYGAMLNVAFHQRIRGEVRFASLEALQRQIEEDKMAARRYFMDETGANAGK